ncbi:hypothetical protein FJY93_01560 [Candidatus Kaiserbacteria bacterium]|nr:hypothetical protein [Candidatus Kaiserbacteria bacterium]
MSDFLQMDIFFFVTTVVVILVGLLIAFILLRIYQILTHVEEISKDFSEESHLVRGDIADLRHHVREQGFKLKFLRSFFQSTLGRFMSSKKGRK